jgi:Cdc6-like AAA superfamily ATPase
MPKAHSKLTESLAPYDRQVIFDDEPLPTCPCNVAVISKKGGGKSTLIRNLLERKESPWYKHFSRIYVVSPTASKDDKMKDLIDDIGPNQHWEVLNEQTLQEILDAIEAHIEEFQSKKGNKGKKPNSLLILDDCLHDMVQKKQVRLMSKLATTNRHIGLTNLYSLQKWNAFLPPVIRSNLDCIAFFRTDNKKELNSFVEEMPTDEDALLSMYRFATAEPYSFLFCNFYGVRPRFFHRFDPIEYKEKVDKADRADKKI